jgi:excisionase family DNA binding protein
MHEGPGKRADLPLAAGDSSHATGHRGVVGPVARLQRMCPDMPSLAGDDLMTAEQVADLLLLRRSTVEDYARRGLLPTIKLGRHRRFLRSDVLAAVEALRSQAS